MAEPEESEILPSLEGQFLQSICVANSRSERQLFQLYIYFMSEYKDTVCFGTYRVLLYYEHYTTDGTVESLLRELRRNKQFRTVCQEELDGMFTELILYMYRNLEHFGEILMVDGKAAQSFGTKPGKNKKSGARGEHDADRCKKQYSASDPNGESVIKTKSGLVSACTWLREAAINGKDSIKKEPEWKGSTEG